MIPYVHVNDNPGYGGTKTDVANDFVDADVFYE